MTPRRRWRLENHQGWLRHERQIRIAHGYDSIQKAMLLSGISIAAIGASMRDMKDKTGEIHTMLEGIKERVKEHGTL